MSAPTIHSVASAQKLDNGDVSLVCGCGARFTGPDNVATNAYRRHLDGPTAAEVFDRLDENLRRNMPVPQALRQAVGVDERGETAP